MEVDAKDVEHLCDALHQIVNDMLVIKSQYSHGKDISERLNTSLDDLEKALTYMRRISSGHASS